MTAKSKNSLSIVPSFSAQHVDSGVTIEIEDPIMYKHHHYRMYLRVKSEWRVHAGIEPRALADAVAAGTWHKYGSSEDAICTICDPCGGPPVRIQVESIAPCVETFPDAQVPEYELYTFDLYPKCTSTRVHMKSQIVLLVGGIPDLPPITSPPVSLRARDHKKPTSASQKSSKISTALQTTNSNRGIIVPWEKSGSCSTKLTNTTKVLRTRLLTPPNAHLLERRNSKKFPMFLQPATLIKFTVPPTSSSGNHHSHVLFQQLVDSTQAAAKTLPPETVAVVPSSISVLTESFPVVVYRPVVAMAIINSEFFPTMYSIECALVRNLSGIIGNYALPLSENTWALVTVYSSTEMAIQIGQLLEALGKQFHSFGNLFDSTNPFGCLTGWSSNLFVC